MLVGYMPKGIPKDGINKGWFKREQSIHNYKGYKIYYDKKGYPCIWLNGRDNKVHILVWEKQNRIKPKGYDIHHKDFDKSNYHIENLELLSFSDHKKVHANWIRIKGKWIAKPCKDCKNVLPLGAFYQRKGLTPSNNCINCSKKKGLENNRRKGIKPKRYIIPNKKGEYQCFKCNQWKTENLFKLKNNKPTSYCKSCFNKYQNKRRRL